MGNTSCWLLNDVRNIIEIVMRYHESSSISTWFQQINFLTQHILMRSCNFSCFFNNFVKFELDFFRYFMAWWIFFLLFKLKNIFKSIFFFIFFRSLLFDVSVSSTASTSGASFHRFLARCGSEIVQFWTLEWFSQDRHWDDHHKMWKVSRKKANFIAC